MTQEEEQRQFNEFWFKLTKKAKEVDDDYKKLSPQNQILVNEEIKKIMVAGGIEEILRKLLLK